MHPKTLGLLGSNHPPQEIIHLVSCVIWILLESPSIVISLIQQLNVMPNLLNFSLLSLDLIFWINPSQGNLMGLPGLSIYGDSKTIIDWLNGSAALNVLELEHWCHRIKDLCGLSFPSIVLTFTGSITRLRINYRRML